MGDSETTISSSRKELLSDLSARATVYFPDHPQYGEVKKVWNHCHDDLNPHVLVRVTGTGDVQACVRYAQREKLQITARSGGAHSIPGLSTTEGGVVVDFHNTKGIYIDEKKQTVRIQPGVQGIELDHELTARGYATTVGTDSDTGVTGLLLHGGWGYMGKKYGWGCTNIVSAEVVLADGMVVTASDAENPDLMWALRGNAHHFGIVTWLEFKIFPLGPGAIVSVLLQVFPFIPGQAAGTIKKAFQTIHSLEEERDIGAVVVIAPGPPPDFQTGIIVLGVYYGSNAVEQGPTKLQPFKSIGQAVMTVESPMPFKVLQTMVDGKIGPLGRRVYEKGGALDMNDEAIETMVEIMSKKTSVLSLALFAPTIGAFRTVSAEQSSFIGRRGDTLITIFSTWLADDDQRKDEHVKWARDADQQMKKFWKGLYANFTNVEKSDVEKDGRLLGWLFGDNFDRLRQVKTKYDPNNFFTRNNQLIKPLP